MTEQTTSARFNALDNKRQTKLQRSEDYARQTLPYLFPDDEYDENSDVLQNSFHSIGAQAVNHLANKMMLALFQPSSPFFRLSMPQAELDKLAQQMGVQSGQIEQVLSNGEREAMQYMARGNYRPQLFEALKHLIVIGDVLPIFDDEGDIELLTLRDYVTVRSKKGYVIELITRHTEQFSMLDADAREAFVKLGGTANEDDDVELFHHIKLNDGKKSYRVTQHINEIQLPADFDSQYADYDRLPWKPQAWVLPAGNDYGVSLVEEYYGDLQSLNLYAEAQTDGALLASLWRFLTNPAGESRPEDIANSRNGDAIPGTPKDIQLLTAQVGGNLSAVTGMMQEVAQRIGRGFLMMASVTRDAERVTAAEIRALANELETGLGGVYTRLASSLQTPMARFLLKSADISIDGTKLRATVVTGFDALSRQSELERMTLFLQDVATVSSLPVEIRDWLKEEEIYNFMAAGRGLEKSKYLHTQQEVDQKQQQRQEAQQSSAIAIEQAKRQQPQGNVQ